MCRLAITILESMNFELTDKVGGKNMRKLILFIYSMTIDKYNKSLYTNKLLY